MKKSFIVGSFVTAIAATGVALYQYQSETTQVKAPVLTEGQNYTHKNTQPLSTENSVQGIKSDATNSKNSISLSGKENSAHLKLQNNIRSEVTHQTKESANSSVPEDSSDMQQAISQLNIPEEVDHLNLVELEEMDERIKSFFEVNEVVQQINDGVVSDADKAHVSDLIRKATKIRSKAFDLRVEGLSKQLDGIKEEIARGDIRMPQPLTYEEIQEVEKLALQEYEELKLQEARRIRIEEEALRQEELMFN